MKSKMTIMLIISFMTWLDICQKAFHLPREKSFKLCFPSNKWFMFSGHELSTYTLTTDQKFIAASIGMIQRSKLFLDRFNNSSLSYYVVKSKASKMQAINMVQRRSKFNTLKCQVGSICCYSVLLLRRSLHWLPLFW